MANEPLQLNLGSLRSAMSLTLHTHHASRIWHGRAPTEARRHHRTQRLHRRHEQDEARRRAGRPVLGLVDVADRGQTLADTKTRLQTLREQVDQALADVPAALSLGENMNVQPVKLPLFVNAQLGFMAVTCWPTTTTWRKLILAHHGADRPQHLGALAQ